MTTTKVLFHLRARWLPTFQDRIEPFRSRLPSFYYTALPTTFRDDVEAGLHSANFDLSGNIATDSEGRSGLDDASKREILKIMRGKKGMNFDEARRVWLERKLEAQGISKDGVPRDPKFVSFS